MLVNNLLKNHYIKNTIGFQFNSQINSSFQDSFPFRFIPFSLSITSAPIRDCSLHLHLFKKKNNLPQQRFVVHFHKDIHTTRMFGFICMFVASPTIVPMARFKHEVNFVAGQLQQDFFAFINDTFPIWTFPRFRSIRFRFF